MLEGVLTFREVMMILERRVKIGSDAHMGVGRGAGDFEI